MKIGKTTREKIESIKQDADEARRTLDNAIVRLNEHAGTKRIATKLDRVVDQLDKWLKSA